MWMLPVFEVLILIFVLYLTQYLIKMETKTLPILRNFKYPATSPIRIPYYKRVVDMVRNYRGFKMNEVINKTPYSIVPITKQHTEQVIHFLRKFFFRDEPLNVAIGLLDEPNTTCQELEDFCMNCIPDGLSLIAVSPKGYLMGVCLNGLITREREEKENTLDIIKNCSNPKFTKILKLLNTIKKHSDLFGHFPQAEKILDIIILSVDENCRGQGICKALVEKTKELAMENNMSLIKVDCSSHFSAKAAAALGFHSIYTLNYEDYVDNEGNRIFNTKPPHNCAKTYVLPLTV